MYERTSERNILDHMGKMVDVFMDHTNEHIFIQSIYDLPYYIALDILSTFIHRMAKKVPHPMIDKYELDSMSNKHNREFTRQLKTPVGRAKSYTQLDVISNIISHARFNEIEYPHEILFQSQLGFTPSIHYMKRLYNTFPGNTLFKVIDMNGIC